MMKLRKNMIKKSFIIIIFCLLLNISVFAFEDCVITTNGKLNDIKVQYNDIIDVFPLITIMNDKNTLIVHPLKSGSSKFSVMKNDKEKFIFKDSAVAKYAGIELFTIGGYTLFTFIVDVAIY